LAGDSVFRTPAEIEFTPQNFFQYRSA
jgi:hypothetical protein